MLHSLLLWLDGDALRFRTVVWATFALCATLALTRSRRECWWNSAPVFGLALVAALFAHRWSTVLDERRLPIPDESQIISDALTYARDPVPFRAVDGNTSGPVTPLSLIAFAQLTFRPLNHVTTRLFGFACLALMLVALWRTLAAVTTEVRARLLTLPALPIIGGAYAFDLLQFNNEHLPAALLAAGLWLLTPLLDDRRALARWRLVLAAVLIGAAPLAKPQAAPITLALAATGLVLLGRHPLSRPDRLTRVLFYAAGGVFPAVVIFGTCAVTGVWSAMWSVFIENNLQYAGARHYPWSDWFAAMLRITGMSQSLTPFYWSTLLAVPLALLGLRWFGTNERRLALVALGFFLGALLAVLAPGKQFTHYLVLLFHPGCLLVGATAAGWRSVVSTRMPARGVVWAAWVLGALLPTPVVTAGHLPYRYGTFGAADPAEREIMAVLRRYAQPGEPMVIWGWAPWIYVWAQQPHATREATVERQMVEWSDAIAYRRRFVSDIARNRPAVFIDTTGPHDFRYTGREGGRYENFLELRRYIALHYVLVWDHELARILVRRDRLPAQQPALAPVMNPAPNHAAGMTPSLMGLGPLGTVVHAHAPCIIVWDPMPEKRRAKFSFGLDPNSYANGNHTNGVRFVVFAVLADGREQTLFDRFLDPRQVEADRGVASGTAAIPAGASVGFETLPGPDNNNNCDWSFWRDVVFEPAP